jgi:sodium-dependent phosphate cotransporter
MHIGDSDFDENDPAYEMDATWKEVCTACCVKSPAEWGMALVGIVGVAFFLYFFLLGLDLLGNGAKVMGGCAAGALFGDDMNPIAGLMVGIVATVLLQSSSTTTSIVVSLVGADTVSVKQGIYMIMGANIGTSVTNTIIAMGHLGDGDQLERAFAGATVHDMFNFLSVGCLLPVELITGYLYHVTKAMVKNFKTQDGEKWEGPVKKLVSPLGKKVIIANKKVATEIAKGTKTCESYYPIGGRLNCTDISNPVKGCAPGLISCNKKADTPYCPAFFDPNATESVDRTSGVCAFVLGLILLFICLFALVKLLQRMMMGASTRVLYKATNLNGYLAILIGAGITMLVQSSSITTSVLTPLVGVGALRLEQMLPLTLGANIGTTTSALLSALLSNKDAMQVALAHLFFNITGIIIWYPIPFMRNIPLSIARALGRGTRLWRGFPLVYIITCFVILPMIFLGISYLFSEGSTGLTVLGSVLVVVLVVGLSWTGFICKYRGGQEKCSDCLVQREKRSTAVRELPDDMEWLKAKVNALADHTALPEDAEDDEIEAPAAEEK